MIELENPNIVVIGGGTGSFTLLQELKHLTPNISALVNMSDDGGSTGRLRDELGVLPPGDVRQCLVALSDAPELREEFSYRFRDPDNTQAGLRGHSLGNLLLSGLAEKYGDFYKAVKVAGSLLKITGKVIPITINDHQLVMEDGDETIRGEFVIGHRSIANKDAVVRLEPEAVIHPDAEEAMHEADLLVIAPGNTYGSLLPALAVKGVAEAFQQSRAVKAVVANLMNKAGQTDDWGPVDYVKKFEEYVGKDQINAVLWNVRLPEHELFVKYASTGECPVDVINSRQRYHEVIARVVEADLIADEPFRPDPNDKAVPRTLIRHDAKKVGEQLMKLL